MIEDKEAKRMRALQAQEDVKVMKKAKRIDKELLAAAEAEMKDAQEEYGSKARRVYLSYSNI